MKTNLSSSKSMDASDVFLVRAHFFDWTFYQLDILSTSISSTGHDESLSQTSTRSFKFAPLLKSYLLYFHEKAIMWVDEMSRRQNVVAPSISQFRRLSHKGNLSRVKIISVPLNW